MIIAAGQTTKTFTVAVIGDRSAEPTETFVVNLSAASNAVDRRQPGGRHHPRQRAAHQHQRRDQEGGQERPNDPVHLHGHALGRLRSAGDDVVPTANGTATTSDSDYVAKTGTLTFAPGETTKTITIDVKGDSKKEANETFYLDLFGNSSNSLFTKKRGIGTILNDD